MRNYAVYSFYLLVMLVFSPHSPALEKTERSDFSFIVEKVGSSVVDVISGSESDEKKLVPDKLRPVAAKLKSSVLAK